MAKWDWLIVGAGFTGAVLAERIATELDQSVLVIDRREHVAGNAYDSLENGLHVHHYGPHIFHTNSQRVWAYLSRFTDWRPYFHHVLGMIDGQQVPVPFNLNSIIALFPPRMADRLCDVLIGHYGFGEKVPVLKLRSEKDPNLRFLANYVYERVFEGYTLKQWGMRPEDLSPGVTARVPIFVSRDDRYFQDRYQAMPRDGYTALFKRLLDHPRITVELKVNYNDVPPARYNRMVFTGPIDEFFGHVHGPLPYRSLRLERRIEARSFGLPVGTVNFPNAFDFTRYASCGISTYH
jgi:UDP-galactopyranose mutase